MTNCKSFNDKLALMALGELSEDETSQVNQHVTECASCAKHFKELSEVTSILSHSLEDHITDLEKLQIENAIYRRLAQSPKRTPLRNWMSSTLRLAAALALISLGYLGGTFSSRSQPLQPDLLSIESQLASLDWKENMATFRLSPQGLKLIAKGRKSLKTN